jgi:hypothetical protein
MHQDNLVLMKMQLKCSEVAAKIVTTIEKKSFPMKENEQVRVLRLLIQTTRILRMRRQSK